jgi:hypothetical protein
MQLPTPNSEEAQNPKPAGDDDDYGEHVFLGSMGCEI